MPALWTRREICPERSGRAPQPFVTLAAIAAAALDSISCRRWCSRPCWLSIAPNRVFARQARFLANFDPPLGEHRVADWRRCRGRLGFRSFGAAGAASAAAGAGVAGAAAGVAAAAAPHSALRKSLHFCPPSVPAVLRPIFGAHSARQRSARRRREHGETDTAPRTASLFSSSCLFLPGNKTPAHSKMQSAKVETGLRRSRALNPAHRREARIRKARPFHSAPVQDRGAMVRLSST